MTKRSISDEEIGLIKAMLHFGMSNKDIQFYFNRQDRAVNSGRITEIKNGTYGPDVQPSGASAMEAFMASFATPTVHQTPVISTARVTYPADPLDEGYVSRFFKKAKDGEWYCFAGESDRRECKTGFNLRHFGKPLRAIAGFANNKGGYLFFGVRDKTDQHIVCGLSDDRFQNADLSEFNRVIRSSLEPTPSFDIRIYDFDSKKVGALYVHPHEAKPVIARKTEGDLAEGVIYFRYPGESRPISYPDLRTILDERDRKGRETLLPMVERLIELGPENALIANLAEGQLEGGKRPILLDESLVERIKFIQEGRFDETNGDETLRVVGDVSLIPSNSLQPTRTVREEVTEIAILKNFIRSAPVEQPIAYLRQASHEQSWILPVFYYVFQAKLSPAEAIATLKSYTNAKPKTRDELIKRLESKRNLYAKAGGNRLISLERIRNREVGELNTLADARPIINAMSALTERDADLFPYAHRLLDSALELWEVTPTDRPFLGELRRAAGRLDELEFAPRLIADN